MGVMIVLAGSLGYVAIYCGLKGYSFTQEVGFALGWAPQPTAGSV